MLELITEIHSTHLPGVIQNCCWCVNGILSCSIKFATEAFNCHMLCCHHIEFLWQSLPSLECKNGPILKSQCGIFSLQYLGTICSCSCCLTSKSRLITVLPVARGKWRKCHNKCNILCPVSWHLHTKSSLLEMGKLASSSSEGGTKSASLPLSRGISTTIFSAPELVTILQNALSPADSVPRNGGTWWSIFRYCKYKECKIIQGDLV